MYTEIEAKLKVDSLLDVAGRLSKVGAEFLEEQVQKDSYFDNANKTLTGTDRCLRLRRQMADKGEKVFLTYKGAREKNKFKKRQEVQVEITDAEAVESLLLAIGFEKILVFEKKRRVWRFGGCEITLDELPLLGSFVEIEGDSEQRIAEAQRNLGLSDLPHIRESYAVLMEEKLSQLGRKKMEALL